MHLLYFWPKKHIFFVWNHGIHKHLLQRISGYIQHWQLFQEAHSCRCQRVGQRSHQWEKWAVSWSCSAITASVLLLLSSVSSISMVIWGTWRQCCHQIGAGQDGMEKQRLLYKEWVCVDRGGTRMENEVLCKCHSVSVHISVWALAHMSESSHHKESEVFMCAQQTTFGWRLQRKS